MSKLFNFNRWATPVDTISDCAKGLKDIEKLKMTLPSEQESKSMFINLKA